uniref:Plac8 onzin related protein 2 n=1 Tax=Lates calcarifer TaxID=8187 RepID=A0A4W6DH86_LATCA
IILTPPPGSCETTGICDCCSDLDVCCFACWCFPCFTCSTMSTFGENFCLPLLDMIVAVRSRYGIQVNMTSDCMYATFCNTCSWCQIAREIKRRKQTLTIINGITVLCVTESLECQRDCG